MSWFDLDLSTKPYQTLKQVLSQPVGTKELFQLHVVGQPVQLAQQGNNYICNL